MKPPIYAGIIAGAAFIAFDASAAVVCNNFGDCWRVKEKLSYPPEARVEIYDDDWEIDTKKYKWREAGVGRGYWRGDVWIEF